MLTGELSGTGATWAWTTSWGVTLGLGAMGRHLAAPLMEKVRMGQGLQPAPWNPSSLPPKNGLPHHHNSVPSLCQERPWKNKYLRPFFQTHFKHQYLLKPSPVLIAALTGRPFLPFYSLSSWLIPGVWDCTVYFWYAPQFLMLRT